MLKAVLPYVDDVNKVDNSERTAAHVAAKYGELECLKMLVANGADLQLVDSFGMQVSHIAAQQDHAEIVEFLFLVGVPLNSVACKRGKLPM